MAFHKYAYYYDLLYQDKDYKSESEYVISLIKRFQKETRKILEFGSGSGIHGKLLAESGFEVIGIDKSQNMIEIGSSPTSSTQHSGNFSCVLGDCTNTYLGDDFDAVISLFHVLSYQTTNQSVLEMLKNAHRQLKQGGILLLDYWYSPAVWNIMPSTRVKRVKSNELAITRIAEPECFVEDKIVKVNYQTFVENLKHNKITDIKETHTMRSFDNIEIEDFANKVGFTVLEFTEWMTNQNPSNESWSVCCILQKTSI